MCRLRDREGADWDRGACQGVACEVWPARCVWVWDCEVWDCEGGTARVGLRGWDCEVWDCEA